MDPTNAKPWYQSSTIIGALVSLLCTAAGAFGVAIAPELQGELTNILIAAGGVVGAALTVYGRIKASRPIALRGGGTAAKVAVALLLLTSLTFGGPVACASYALSQAEASTPAQRLYAVHADYNTALAAAVAYAESPLADRDVVRVIERLADQAIGAIRAARAAMLAGEDARVAVAIAAANAAVAELAAYVTRQGAPA